MKKLLIVAALSAILTACAGTDDINQSRGGRTARISQAELDQYNKQRANEAIEARTQAEKAAGYSEVIRQGSSAVESGVGAIKSIMSIFGR